MALKFLNKKGWHTGSLRNIENVWKAEQKHEAEQSKLEELRKQIQEEKERSEFRLLQEQAGLVPKQERLEFLYDSGLAVGKGSSSSSFKALESLPKTDSEILSSSSDATKQQQSTVPGALFEEKPQSANDAWRKLHSDPLLLIRQREQEALARIKNNPVQMTMIRKSVESKKSKEKSLSAKKHQKKDHYKSKHHKHPTRVQHSDSNSENVSLEDKEIKTISNRKRSIYGDPMHRTTSKFGEESRERDYQRKKNTEKDLKYRRERHGDHRSKRTRENTEGEKYRSEGRSGSHDAYKGKEDKRSNHASDSSNMIQQGEHGKDDGYRSNRNHEYIEGEKYCSEGRSGFRDANKGREDKRSHQASDSSHIVQQDRSEGWLGSHDAYKGMEDKRSHQASDSSNMIQQSERGKERDGRRSNRNHEYIEGEKYHSEGLSGFLDANKGREDKQHGESHYKRRHPCKLSEEERAARLQEMQMDAELHEEQRWKRLRKAEEKDAEEALRERVPGGKNFLDAAHKSVYGAEKGGSSTIEESVRRRKYYMQGRSAVGEGNAFRR